LSRHATGECVDDDFRNREEMCVSLTTPVREGTKPLGGSESEHGGKGTASEVQWRGAVCEGVQCVGEGLVAARRRRPRSDDAV